jgi:hypothetical protein
MERWRDGGMEGWRDGENENLVVKVDRVKVFLYSKTFPSGFALLNPDFSRESDVVRLR